MLSLTGAEFHNDFISILLDKISCLHSLLSLVTLSSAHVTNVHRVHYRAVLSAPALVEVSLRLVVLID